ncbi:MAG: hypothetical protein ACKVS9_19445 [Phycisphaerae bacterium]
MLQWFSELDELLRGQRTSPDALVEGRLRLSPVRLLTMAIFLGAIYGFFMGWFAVLNRPAAEYKQVIATVVKLPALFLLTLAITFPSLYVFNALVGCRLTWSTTLRLLIGAVLVNLAVAASLGPILGFFTFSTSSYPFMVLLNVILLGIAGAVGLGFLLQTLRRAARRQAELAAAQSAAQLAQDELGMPEPLGAPPEPLGAARLIFQIWVILFGLVGAQMGWLLRPFIGDPSVEFAWFRPRSGSFFESISAVVRTLLSP